MLGLPILVEKVCSNNLEAGIEAGPNFSSFVTPPLHNHYISKGNYMRLSPLHGLAGEYFGF